MMHNGNKSDMLSRLIETVEQIIGEALHPKDADHPSRWPVLGGITEDLSNRILNRLGEFYS